MVVMLAQAKGDREIKFSSAAYSLYTLDKYNIVKCPIALSAIEIEPRFKTGKWNRKLRAMPTDLNPWLAGPTSRI